MSLSWSNFCKSTIKSLIFISIQSHSTPFISLITRSMGSGISLHSQQKQMTLSANPFAQEGIPGRVVYPFLLPTLCRFPTMHWQSVMRSGVVSCTLPPLFRYSPYQPMSHRSSELIPVLSFSEGEPEKSFRSLSLCPEQGIKKACSFCFGKTEREQAGIGSRERQYYLSMFIPFTHHKDTAYSHISFTFRIHLCPEMPDK